MSEISVTPLREKDQDDWARMRHELWPECPPERHALEKAFYEKPDTVVLLARAGDRPCGFAEVVVRNDPVEGSAASPVPYLEGWYVEAEFRGRGVGRALLRAAEDWARDLGYRELGSDAESANTHSIRAHLATGFREVGRNVCFIKSL